MYVTRTVLARLHAWHRVRATPARRRGCRAHRAGRTRPHGRVGHPARVRRSRDCRAAMARDALDTLLAALVDAGGSDLHLTAGAPPMIRVHGDLTPAARLRRAHRRPTPRCSSASIVTPEQWAALRDRPRVRPRLRRPRRLSRFRVNLFQQRNAYGAVMRAIPHDIKPLHELGIPEQIARFARLPRGLVLVTGPTGSGKTTTLAALLDLANRDAARPHRHDRGPDRVPAPAQAVPGQPARGRRRHRRLRRGAQARAAAGPRHHPGRRAARPRDGVDRASPPPRPATSCSPPCTPSRAAQTIDRVIDIFPPHQQQEIRAQLSTALQGVVTQALCRTADGTRTHGRLRGHVRHRRDPQPDPRGQEPPDPVVHAVLRRATACSPSTSTWPSGSTRASITLRAGASTSATRPRNSSASPGQA